MIIRRIPQDFRVIETLMPGVVVPSPGAFAVYRVTKTTLTTPEAAARLAKCLKVKPASVEYAGLKDKHAVTTQYMTVAGVKSAPERLEEQAFEAEHAGCMPRHVTAADIGANWFEIVLRDATREQFLEMERRWDLLAMEDDSLACVNYFGEQRMGSARHGGGFVARRLVDGDFEGALKLAIGTPARKDSGVRRALTRGAATHWGNWTLALEAIPRCPQRKALETLAAGGSFKDAFVAMPFFEQQMFVDAYQSHLWNRTAASIVSGGAGLRSIEFEEDGFEFLAAAAWDASLREMQIPLPRKDASITEAVRPGVEAALSAEGLGLNQLEIPGLRRPAFGSAARSLLVAAKAASMSPWEKDDLTASGKRLKRMLRFELPRGAYATVVLRALGQ